MSDVTPALTQQEWAEKSLSGRGSTEPLFQALIDPDDNELVLAGAWIRADERHAIAALALHEQSFGFTPDDIEAIDYALGEWRHLWVEAYGDGAESSPEECAIRSRLESLTDRLAALLPPSKDSA